MSTEYLALRYSKETELPSNLNKYEYQKLLKLPFAESELIHAHVTDCKLLSKGEDVKSVYQLSLGIKDISCHYQPGNTIGILPQNDEHEIKSLLQLLKLEDIADLKYTLAVNVCSKSVPSHLPLFGTIRQTLMYNLDIRSPPKKIFLRTLQRYATTYEDQNKLSLIVGPSGSDNYMELLNSCGGTLLGVLRSFPSCHLPVERLFENLPPLKPRLYSICSSPLKKEVLDITFSVIHNEYGSKGVCSGWLENIARYIDCSQIKIPFFFRKTTNFILPENLLKPIIMIGPGTGIAPFMSFLRHRYLEDKLNGTSLGISWLFFGCRYENRDFLYKNEIYDYLKKGTLSKLFIAFSRENEAKCYVQTRIIENGKEFTDMIVHKNASVFVCGDAKGMVASIRRTIASTLITHAEFDSRSVEEYIANLQKTGMYVEDTWV